MEELISSVFDEEPAIESWLVSSKLTILWIPSICFSNIHFQELQRTDLVWFDSEQDVEIHPKVPSRPELFRAISDSDDDFRVFWCKKAWFDQFNQNFTRLSPRGESRPKRERKRCQSSFCRKKIQFFFAQNFFDRVFFFWNDIIHNKPGMQRLGEFRHPQSCFLTLAGELWPSIIIVGTNPIWKGCQRIEIPAFGRE